MRKVLIIPSWYPSTENRGLGTFFLEQNRVLSDNLQIKVLCCIQKRDISRLSKVYNTLNFALFRKIKLRDKKNYFIEPPEVIGFEYESGLNFLTKMNYKISINAFLQSAKSLFKVWSFSIIHAHDTLVAGIVAFYLKRDLNIPYLITEHNYLQFKFPDYIRKDFLQAIEFSNQTLLVSEYQLRNLLMYEIKCKADVIGNFVDDSIFKPQGNLKAEKVFNILFIGRNAYHKDIETLLKVIIEFEKLCDSGSFCFTIIGSNFDRERNFQEMISMFESTNKIEIIPFVERDEIIRYFNKADVYLSTSIAETFGVGICEAMMCGIPVVSTNNGGFDEMFIPGVNGLKCKIGDFRTLATQLFKIKSKEIVFDKSEIRESVIKKFGRAAFKLKMQNVYDKIYE
jgi:glycosyltransferase involved in cell wall biosynthesis